ncbi:MAG: UDP-N-acetylglucosamine 2-epimerase (non-hydrolyzing), partial [Sphingobacteriales bacterium]
PRTRKNLDNGQTFDENLVFSGPLSYLEFMYLLKHAKGVVTDSGGITEEATVLNIPCLTLRNSTERPETIELGTNVLIGNDIEKLRNCLKSLKEGQWKQGTIPELWDGKASVRIISHLKNIYGIKRVSNVVCVE